MKKIGLLVNPIAGMGGKLGFKGTDGVAEKCISEGAEKRSLNRTEIVIDIIQDLREDFKLITGPGKMGEVLARKYDLQYDIIGEPKQKTTARDTIEISREMLTRDIDLLIFSGGDGTARDIYKAVGEKLLVLGVPTGVKIHSPVYARKPKLAGYLLKEYILGDNIESKLMEVIDLDEREYRQGMINTSLFGYLKVLYKQKVIQNKKARSKESERSSQEAIATFLRDKLDKNQYYIIGPGTTTNKFLRKIGVDATLIGVDLIQNNKLILKDLAEDDLLKIMYSCPNLIITPIGGQGFLFGRGNQQLSPAVLKHIDKDNIQVVATKEKLYDLNGKPMILDTSSEYCDQRLKGYYKVIIGYGEYMIYPAVAD